MGGKAGAKKRVSKTKEIPQEDVQKDNYTVEKIVGDRIIKGKTQYKVHWAGYSTDEETWENESQLDCNEILEEYLAEIAENNDMDEKNREEVTTKPARSVRGQDGLKSSRKEEDQDLSETEEEAPEDTSSKYSSTKKGRGGQEKGSKSKKFKKDEAAEDNAGGESNTAAASGEYVVERIIDMHTLKSGKREFLIRWKGFRKGDDTWEPESHLEGTDILEKFLQKVEKAKELPVKELRLNRRPTDRFTTMPQGDKRRQSKRHANHQRVKYYDAE